MSRSAEVGATKRLARQVEWRDLMAMQPVDGWIECLHPAPWLLGSWAFAYQAVWPASAACSFMFFLTALRLNHEAIHGNLGFGPRGHSRVIHGLSAFMLGCNSAVAFNHLQHRAHLGKPRDVEGKCGRMNAWQVIAYGPAFPIELHIAAWRRGGPAVRRRMLIDGGLNAGIGGAALMSGAGPLLYHLLAMGCAQCLTGFFAVCITHRGCHGHDLVARTQRSWLINFVTYNMLFHLEHHMFPAVPVRRLGRLAARIDAAAPDIIARARTVL